MKFQNWDDVHDITLQIVPSFLFRRHCWFQVGFEEAREQQFVPSSDAFYLDCPVLHLWKLNDNDMTNTFISTYILRSCDYFPNTLSFRYA